MPDSSDKESRMGFLPVNFCSIDPWKSSILNIQKRHLPHLSAIEATYFVTFRCNNGMSIPEKARHGVLSAILHWNGSRMDLDAAVVMPDHVHIIFRLMTEAEGDKEDDVLYFDKLEACPTTEIHDAATPKNKDEKIEGDKLEACPTLSKIIHSIKSYSANRINKILGRKGSFWLHENFDHIIRNETDWREKVRYIIENPLKKELVDKPESYKWLWVRKDIDLKYENIDPELFMGPSK